MRADIWQYLVFWWLVFGLALFGVLFINWR